MILGIGTDITNINRIISLMEKYKNRFSQKYFSNDEILYIEKKAKNKKKILCSGYAKRWAAKEACAKALGSGIINNIFLKDIVITNNNNGRPDIILNNGAKRYLEKITPKNYEAKIDLSLSDDYPFAIAFVIISTKET